MPWPFLTLAKASLIFFNSDSILIFLADGDSKLSDVGVLFWFKEKLRMRGQTQDKAMILSVHITRSIYVLGVYLYFYFIFPVHHGIVFNQPARARFVCASELCYPACANAVS